jgi:hypothetical protein
LNCDDPRAAGPVTYDFDPTAHRVVREMLKSVENI